MQKTRASNNFYAANESLSELGSQTVPDLMVGSNSRDYNSSPIMNIDRGRKEVLLPDGAPKVATNLNKAISIFRTTTEIPYTIFLA